MINLLGLSLGIASVLVIFMIADYEKSFDNFHSVGKNIYRVVTKSDEAGKDTYQATLPNPVSRFLRIENPGIVATQIHYAKKTNVRIGNQTPFVENNIVFADSLFFKVFDFGKIKKFNITGDPSMALSAPGKAIVTESTAKRYFGNANPIGQLIRLENIVDVEVAAIIRDVPASTHLPLGMIVSLSSLTKDFVGGIDLNSWNVVTDGYCYVKADNNTVVNTVESALAAIVKKNSSAQKDSKTKMYLQPLRQIHFDPTFDTTNITYTVSPKYLLMLLLLGGFIILIACINYINLSTSLAFTKSKEVGIRKTIGASKVQLFMHYITETFTLTLIAAVIGIVIAVLFLPAINRMLDKSISIDQLLTLPFITGAVFALLLISFISGIYPALVLSGFKPIESLKNQLALPGKSSTLLRKS
ncbi:MAG: ABC transporter permease, partial [Ginsengibacter sp.]